jgi:hypothetical protein
MAPLCYRRHHFPPEIIQNAIWLSKVLSRRHDARRV